MVGANNSWVIGLDNLSYISPTLSDALCRLATGGGFATRALYTDDDERIFNIKRPMILNGIEEVATRNDLLDRSVILYLPEIPQASRRSESELWAEFRREHPRILGALLDAVAGALRNRDAVQLEGLPRMADFAVWATAGEEALGIALVNLCGRITQTAWRQIHWPSNMPQ